MTAGTELRRAAGSTSPQQHLLKASTSRSGGSLFSCSEDDRPDKAVYVRYSASKTRMASCGATHAVLSAPSPGNRLTLKKAFLCMWAVFDMPNVGSSRRICVAGHPHVVHGSSNPESFEGSHPWFLQHPSWPYIDCLDVAYGGTGQKLCHQGLSQGWILGVFLWLARLQPIRPSKTGDPW
jgi:hypothetical protein